MAITTKLLREALAGLPEDMDVFLVDDEGFARDLSSVEIHETGVYLSELAEENDEEDACDPRAGCSCGCDRDMTSEERRDHEAALATLLG